MLEVVELPADEGEEILARAMPEPVKEDVVTAADQLRAQGERRGERRGRREGARDLLLALLRSFGPLPPEVEQRVRAATLEEIEGWALRVRGATGLDDVFGEGAE